MKKEEIIKELRDLGVDGFDESATNTVLSELLKSKRETVKAPTSTANPLPAPLPPGEIKIPEPPKEETMSISKKDWDDVQKQLKMLYDVADKGRLFNYESRTAEKKPIRVKLSIHNGKIIVGWRTMRDELIKHPQTGKTVGEKQEFELVLLDNVGDKSTVLVDGYEAFSSARYNERIEVEVTGKKEDWKGNYTYTVSLPDGRAIEIDGRFVN